LNFWTYMKEPNICEKEFEPFQDRKLGFM